MLPPEKYEAMRELPTKNVAVDVRKSVPTSTATFRCECPLSYRSAGVLLVGVRALRAFAAPALLPVTFMISTLRRPDTPVLLSPRR